AELRKPQPPSSTIKPKAKAPAPPPAPTPASPFELSEADMDAAELIEDDRTSQHKALAGSNAPGSSDDIVELGELQPGSSSISPVEAGGINLQAPADSGISLEKRGTGDGEDAAAELESSDFELNMEQQGGAAEAAPAEEESSDFEL